ncbi:MAG: SUMF1/EgtB/PvdO family nonheme iron enzyme [Candidatus Eisenbacteria bacterium]|nr:SUMF1/EgtB/PvdO family nonheme iron enzyme [Candidatus Eisenbacteria bacterium]
MIGKGGMGVVYLAYDEKLKRQVALKILSAILALTPAHLERFQRTAQIAANLSHPSIVKIHQLNQDKGFAYIASEFVEGRDLAQEVARRKAALQPTWNPREAALLLAEVADALHHAHQKGVIHRDVKPGNILLDSRGRAYLTDFGLAKMLDEQGLTRTGDVAGTFLYMSPEQARSAQPNVDHRTDIFSLGVVLYELVAGVRPFSGDTREAILTALESVRPRPLWQVVPGTPRDLDVIIQRALEKRPEDRFETAADFAADLRRFAEGTRPHARPPGPWRRLRRWARRHRRAVWAGVGTSALLFSGILTGRAMRSDGLVAVEFASEPSGALVAARPLLLETGEYGAATELGSTPCRRRLRPGHYRFVFQAADGFAEASRVVGSEEPGQSIHQVIVLTPEAVEGMIQIGGGVCWSGFRRKPGVKPPVPDPPPDVYQERCVAGFYIDRTEVTNGQYGAFLRATGHGPPLFWTEELEASRRDVPVVGLTWRDARAYAEWRGKRLPTRLEWERAARGVDGRRYPWGDSLVLGRPLAEMGSFGTGLKLDALGGLDAYLAAASPVGTHPMDCTPDGLLDMLGNVLEWVDTPDIRNQGDALVAIALQRLAMGASWRSKERYIDLQNYLIAPEDTPIADANIGFRCAKSQDP